MTSLDQPRTTAEITSLLTDLIAIPTAYPPGNTSRMASYLVQVLEAAGYHTEVHAAEPGLDNVVARLGTGSPSLVFNAHVDTVDAGDVTLWNHPPLEAVIGDGFLYGLGAANCKGSTAVHLWLAQEIARRGGPAKGEVVFTFVTDEESLGPNGMSFLRDKGVVKPDMLLLGAPTDNTLITTERGVLWTEITTSGRPAHAGQPEDGDNAILRMVRVISHLERELMPRLTDRVDGDMRSTINIGMLNGGRNTNVVPSHCTAQIDRRLLPLETVDQAFEEIRMIVEATGEPEEMVSIKRLRGTNGFRGDENGPLVESLSAAIEQHSGSKAEYSTAIGVSDGRYFADDNIEIVNFGPGIGSEGHASNESVSLSALFDSAVIQNDVISRILGFTN